MLTLQDFKRPKSVDEAVAMLREGPGRGGIIAGGTTLGMARMMPYDYLVDITGIGLSEIQRNDHLVRIGATTTIQQLATAPVLQSPELRFLSQAALSVATRQIRNMATVGGNLVSGYPMADLPAAILVVDAQLVLVGADRTKLSLRDFFDPGASAGLNGGLVTEITFPLPPADSRSRFIKLARTENDVALLDLACLVRLKDGRFEEVRVGLGSAVLRPLRLRRVEDFLQGKSAEEKYLTRAAELSTENLSILDNIRGSRAYRTEMVQVLLRRELRACVLKGGGER
jgi:carbon-monoxide dehydrogenase medium subunit